MSPVVFFTLVFLTAASSSSSKKVCNYQDVLDYLNLTTDNGVFRLTRPVLDHTRATVVELNILLYSILAVLEKTQIFIPFIWVTVTWNNERILWDPAQFCGITRISVPKDMLWRPDLLIYEMVQKDESPHNPYVSVNHDGTITLEEDMRVVSTCKMDVHKFPFDTQRCNVSISSASHCVSEIRLLPSVNSSRATQFSREMIKSQGEWEFLHLAVIPGTVTFEDRSWDQLTFTITMKRRPLLHVINFLLPILFSLSLDLASFFISDHRGEKLGFKVTVLLAISVLLLILNEILPSMSNRTPLIATYCIVIFALMLLSLLETIMVTYLMDLDSRSCEKLQLKDDWDDKQEKVEIDDCGSDEKRQVCCSYVCKERSRRCEKQHKMLPLSQEVNKNLQLRESNVLLLILDELKLLQKTVSVYVRPREEGGKFTRWATRINRGFYVFYFTVVILFLSLMYNEWSQ